MTPACLRWGAQTSRSVLSEAGGRQHLNFMAASRRPAQSMPRVEVSMPLASLDNDEADIGFVRSKIA